MMGLKIATVRLVAGKIDCQPQPLEADRLDDIEWKCDTGQPFTVDFLRNSPSPQRAFPAKAGGKAKASVPAAAALNKKYEYLIALYDGAPGLILTLDPDLIIRR